MAGCAVGFGVYFVVFDVVLHLTAIGVDLLIDGGLIRLGEVGNHKAGAFSPRSVISALATTRLGPSQVSAL